MSLNTAGRGADELLSDLAAELVRRQLAVLAAVGGNQPWRPNERPQPSRSSSRAVRTPFRLVSSQLESPGRDVTGISWFDTELGPKQLRLLSELVPNVTVAVLIVNPQRPEVADQRDTAQRAARALGWSCMSSQPAA